MRGLNPLAVELYLAALDGLGRLVSGFEESSGPEPFVEPNFYGFIRHVRCYPRQ
jgi:hypothetical protein